MNIAKIVREAREQSRLTALDFRRAFLMTLSTVTVLSAMMVQLLVVLAGGDQARNDIQRQVYKITSSEFWTTASRKNTCRPYV